MAEKVKRSNSPTKNRQRSALKQRKRSPVKDALLQEVLGFDYQNKDINLSPEKKAPRRVRFDSSRSPMKKTLSTKSPEKQTPGGEPQAKNE